MSTKSSISQRGKRYNFDVLVIGSGIAGLCYCLELSKLKPNCKIALITKKELVDSNSNEAQGGIAAATEKYDTIEQHIKDTIKAGDGLANPKVVKKILNYGPSAIQTLINFGVNFSKKKLAQEGGHSQRRVYHIEDHTGQEIISALIKKVKKTKQIKIFNYHTAINLITKGEEHIPGNNPEVIGAYVLDEKQNLIHTFSANAIVLATGGAGKVYRYTSNPQTATGDGIAMAYRAGARVGNLEFYQFHPTLLYDREFNSFLISETVRGEGAHLLNPNTLKRFMRKYDSKKMELATRDIIAKAIFNEIEHTEQNYVFLDIRHKTKTFLKKRFPMIFNALYDHGIDMSKDLIPIVPAAHYLCGGILTDVAGHTDIKRLYAIGETAFTGLHGANRLASNSLLEGVVMAHYAAEDSIKWLNQPDKYAHVIKNWDSKSVTDSRRASQLNSHWRGLRGEMSSYAGIIRTQHGLEDLLKLIQTRKEMIEECYWKYTITRDLIELRNIVLVAELIVKAALKRKESRGGHYREDYPQKFRKSHESILERSLI
jgi:L-aspartate oxidase